MFSCSFARNRFAVPNMINQNLITTPCSNDVIIPLYSSFNKIQENELHVLLSRRSYDI